MPAASKRVAIPVVACCLLLVAIGGTIAYLILRPADDQKDKTANHPIQDSKVYCHVCGNTRRDSKFFEEVFRRYLSVTKEEHEVEYGDRCNDDIRNNDNEESGVPCGTDGVCWVILFWTTQKKHYSQKEKSN